MPPQQLPVRLPRYIIRRLNRPAVQRVVVPAVLELLLDPPADLEPELRSDGDITAIKEALCRSSEQESIRHVVRATFGVGANVRCIQGGKCPLPRDRAASIVSVCHQEPEGSLPEPRPNQYRRTKPFNFAARSTGLQADCHGLPKSRPIGVINGVGFSLNDLPRPGWHWDPVIPVQKERSGHDPAADREALMRARLGAPISGYPGPHLGEGVSTIGLTEGLPGK